MGKVDPNLALPSESLTKLASVVSDFIKQYVKPCCMLTSCWLTRSDQSGFVHSCLKILPLLKSLHFFVAVFFFLFLSLNSIILVIISLKSVLLDGDLRNVAVCGCVQQGVDESGLELRDTDSLHGMAHKNNWIKIEEADGKKTEDKQNMRWRETGGQTGTTSRPADRRDWTVGRKSIDSGQRWNLIREEKEENTWEM